jgi:hypothetical protein
MHSSPRAIPAASQSKVQLVSNQRYRVADIVEWKSVNLQNPVSALGSGGDWGLGFSIEGPVLMNGDCGSRVQGLGFRV